MQSRLGSFIETLINVAIGYVVALLVQLIVYPLYGASFSLSQNIQIGLIFTAVSVLRGYVIRRWFNARVHRAAMRLAGDEK